MLSNIYPYAITYNISFASSEYVYQYEKCVRLYHKKTAESILSAPTAKEAKSIADGVVSDRL